MVTQAIPGAHPLVALARVLDQQLDAVAEVDPLYLPARDQATTLLGLARARERLAELELRVLAAADPDALSPGVKSPGRWLAHETNQAVGLVAVREQLGHDLQRYELLRRAFAAGTVTEAQARAVVAVLDDLPTDLGAELLGKAEAAMVTEAGRCKPQELKRVGLHLLEILAPDIADAAEEERLRREESNARARTRLQFKPLGNGATRISATVPDSVAAKLKTQLAAFANPRRDHLTPEGFSRVDPATGKRIPYDQLLGHALCDLVENITTDRLPVHGGTTTSLVITIDLDKLKAGIGAGVLSTGQTISAAEARRIACQSGAIPAVLGGKGQPLDLGRRRRFFTQAQRIALEIRDRTCRAQGCDMPAPWCEAHHKDPWSQGGRTDLDDGALLCSRHHHLIHGTTYHHTWHPDGTLTFHRRT